MVELTTIFGLTQTLAIIVGVIIALMELRHLRQTRNTELETRQAQIFWRMIEKAYSKEGLDYVRVLGNATWSSYEEWLELRRDDLECYTAYRWIGQLYEGIGTSVRLGHADIKLLAYCMPRDHLRWWEGYRDVVYGQRKRTNDRRYGSNWEYLYNELVKYLEEHPELAP